MSGTELEGMPDFGKMNAMSDKCPKCRAILTKFTCNSEGYHSAGDVDGLYCLRRQLAERTRERDTARAACAAMVLSFRKIIPIAECGLTELPPGHTCGPEGNCDCNCMARSYEERDLAEARGFMYKPNPGQSVLARPTKARLTTAEADNKLGVCVGCMKQFPRETEADKQAIADHIVACEKHPLHGVLAENADLRRQLAEAQEACASWKEWHRKISDLVGAKYLERTVTTKTIKALLARLAKAEAVVAKLVAACQGLLLMADAGACPRKLDDALT